MDMDNVFISADRCMTASGKGEVIRRTLFDLQCIYKSQAN